MNLRNEKSRKISINSDLSNSNSLTSDNLQGVGGDNSEFQDDELADLSHITLPLFESSKTSNKRSGKIRSYAANTNQGISRNYNEDRVSIILNIK